ncbi:Protein of unknown function (DUF2971) (plasmid) [Mycobacterium sp. JS623]|uniref:DUF2971 domain-containing protein n=1 Tax=Mycobacterium sp. JS623 TaxID=212767 RepID=UPI0002A5A015|nr:DUF2971 domain-containing protein [Mycobacterium sp. JS623]AGB26873.1 Protein of unknown function (DUF2971) [Mycobacterium sp. JS623]
MRDKTTPFARSAAAAAQDRNEIKARFEKAHSEQKDAWRELQGSPPDRLYHYTTVDGMRGIVGAQCIWASDVRFMNDSSELSYARDLIEEEIQAVLKEATAQRFIGPLADRERLTTGVFENVVPFIACFCEVDDLLSQWHGYGQSDDGSVSLGLDLRRYSDDSGSHDATLRRVIYDETLQRNLVRESANQWLRVARSLADEIPADEIPTHGPLRFYALSALQTAMLEYYLCFKHPTFAEEREWRLIGLVDLRSHLRRMGEIEKNKYAKRMDYPAIDPTPSSESSGSEMPIHILFRRSAYGLTPYIELPLRDSDGDYANRLEILGVTQGPRAHAELALESLRMYLQSAGYLSHPSDVRATSVPLRR